MRQDVEALADAMERGWRQVPHMATHVWVLFNKNDEVEACCAVGHAVVGSGDMASGIDFRGKAAQHYPVLLAQRVIFAGGYEVDLCTAIGALVAEGWNTPRVVRWLRRRAKVGG